jgi:putative nucleotidyltransferase with HDIG domain
VPSPVPATPPRRVLFVDDERLVLDGLRRMLHAYRHTWQMGFAEGGSAALEMMMGTPYDVVVTDMRMPDIDGLALLALVRARLPESVRIVLSGHADLEVAVSAASVAHQFLSKPCSAADLADTVDRATRLRDVLDSAPMRRLLGSVGSLPLTPRMYTKLSAVLRDASSSVEAVAAIVQEDAGLAAKLLQLANSAFFGARHSICSVRAAVAYVGLRALPGLVLSLEISRDLGGGPEIEAWLEGQQQHAVVTARIAASISPSPAVAEVAFTAGLLHDIGRLVLAARAPEVHGRLSARGRSESRPVWTLEEEELGGSHAALGAYLLGLWGLPTAVVEAVARHHRPFLGPAAVLDAPLVVHLAQAFADELGAVPSVENAGLDPVVVQRLGPALQGLRGRAAPAATATTG